MRRDLLKRGRDLWEEFSEVSVATYASSISYFTFLSLVPILAICIALLTAIGISEQQFVSFIATVVPDALVDFVGALASDAYERSSLAFSISSLTLLWTASKGAKALRVGLNAAYAQKETRGALAVEVISVVAGLVLDLLLVATIYVVFSGSVLRFLASVVPGLGEQNAFTATLNAAAMMAVGVVALSVCYAFLPAGMRRPTTQLPGAVCATLACGALSYGFRVYVDSFCNFTMLYGGLATVALLLFWMYLVSYILVVGGFLNRILTQER